MERRDILGCAIAAALLVGPALPAAAGAMCHQALDQEPADEAGDTITYTQVCATPTVLRAPVGTRVTWINKDPGLHNVRSGWGLWADAELDEGETFSHTFTRAGIYPYYCSLHASMGGVVIVGDEEAAPVSAADTDDPAQVAGSESGMYWALLLGVAAFGGFAVGRKGRAQG